MKAALRFFMILAICLIPFTFMEIKERFPIMVGITIAVTIAYWASYSIIERKRRKVEADKE